MYTPEYPLAYKWYSVNIYFLFFFLFISQCGFLKKSAWSAHRWEPLLTGLKVKFIVSISWKPNVSLASGSLSWFTGKSQIIRAGNHSKILRTFSTLQLANMRLIGTQRKWTSVPKGKKMYWKQRETILQLIRWQRKPVIPCGEVFSGPSCCSVAQSCLTVFRPHRLQHTRLPCPSPSPRVCSNSCHWVNDDIQPSHPLLSPSPPAFNLSQHQGLFKWVSSSHQVAKVLEFQLQHVLNGGS